MTVKSAYVVDTNVAIVASGRSDHASPGCVIAAIDGLRRVRSGGKAVIDERNRILTEYFRRLSRSGQPGVGEAFVKWVSDNQGNPELCERVEIHPRSNPRGEDYVEFPDTQALAGFDHDDRKFVAVALASQLSPSILNAVDSDWWDYRLPLRKHGVEIEFLCPGQFNGGD